jgi:hypothetical protein
MPRYRAVYGLTMFASASVELEAQSLGAARAEAVGLLEGDPEVFIEYEQYDREEFLLRVEEVE